MKQTSGRVIFKAVMHIQFMHRILLKLHKTPLCKRLDCEEFFKAHSCNSPEIPTSKIEEKKKEMAYYRTCFIFVLAVCVCV